MRKTIIGILVLLIQSCLGQINVLQTDTLVKIGTEKKWVTISYSGCGGFYIESNHSAVLMDPYFSNIGPMLLVPFKKLETDTVSIEEFFEKVDTSYVSFLLTGHTHIDHVGDYPYILKNKLSTRTQLVGNKSLSYLLASDKKIPESFQKVIFDKEEEWIYAEDSLVRVMPILSQHAPHLFGLKFAPSKPLEQPYESYPVKSSGFPEGKNYNFIIDFLNSDKSIEIRVFSSAAAAAAAPWGLPKKEILQEKKVDVLLLCGASHQNAENYPDTLLARTNPKFIVISHWENFFKPWQKLKEKPDVVPLTNMKKLEQILKKYSTEKNYIFPNVGTNVEFKL